MSYPGAQQSGRLGADFFLEAGVVRHFSQPAYRFLLGFDRRDRRSVSAQTNSLRDYQASTVCRYYQALIPLLTFVFNLHLHSKANTQLYIHTVEFLYFVNPVVKEVLDDSVADMGHITEDLQPGHVAHLHDALTAVQLLSALLHQLLKARTRPSDIQGLIDGDQALSGPSPFTQLKKQLSLYTQLAFKLRKRSSRGGNIAQSQDSLEVESLLFEVIRNILGIGFELTRPSLAGEAVDRKIPLQANARVNQQLRQGYGGGAGFDRSEAPNVWFSSAFDKGMYDHVMIQIVLVYTCSCMCVKAPCLCV